MKTYSRETSLTGNMRINKWFSGITAVLTVFFFMSTFYLVPCAHALDEASQADKARKQYHPKGRTDEEKLSNTLQAIKERVAERKAKVRSRVESESTLWQDFLNLFGLSALATEDLDQLQAMAEQTEQLHQKALESFDRIEQELIAKGLPDEILQRHYDTVDKYRAEYRSFRRKLEQTRAAQSLQDQDSALEELDEFLDKQQFKRRQQPFDPNHLPFGTPDPKKTREPITDPQELNQLLGLAPPQPGLMDKIGDTLVKPAYAAPGDPPTDADLAETIDVQITPEIQQLAADLNNSPVEIYNWVRNNIEFIPTYGSIQGSDITRQTRRGNAFDTASLLIALLRAAGTPARYAMGVVQIPVDQVMNWVGGVEAPEAALSLLGQGGIPSRGITEGGLIKFVEIEHVWVEAYIDFEPSRGAENISGDSWIPLDASFKQYDYLAPVDFQSQIPFDSDTFFSTIESGITVTDQVVNVENLDLNAIENQIQQYREQIEDYVNNQMSPDAISDALGSKKIRQDDFAVLSGSLPYVPVINPSRFSAIGSNFRHKYRFQIVDQFGDVVLSQTLDLPDIAGKTLALSFRPKTDQDAMILSNSVPNDPLDPANTSVTIPGYLVNVEGAFLIDNQVVVQGGQFKFGEDVYTECSLYQPLRGWLAPTQNTIVAGEYHALGVDTGYTNKQKLEKLDDYFSNLQDSLQEFEDTGDASILNSITGVTITGSLLQVGIVAYFLANQVSDLIAARNLSAVSYKLPSYGSFSTSVNTSYLFGFIPRSADLKGFAMDVDMISTIAESRNYNSQERINFVRIIGQSASAFEHVVPEQLFSSETEKVQGISAVKALSIAAGEGQNIYALNQSNQSLLSNVVVDQDARNEIIRAINSGNEVTVHEHPINAYGFSGSGYLIINPATGAGAYKISGGANGGEVLDVDLSPAVRIYKYIALFFNAIKQPYAATFLRQAAAVIDLIGGLFQIEARCYGAVDTAEIVLIWVIYSIITILIVWLLLPLGIIAWFILSYILLAIRDFFMEGLFYLAGCREG